MPSLDTGGLRAPPPADPPPWRGFVWAWALFAAQKGTHGGRERYQYGPLECDSLSPLQCSPGGSPNPITVRKSPGGRRAAPSKQIDLIQPELPLSFVGGKNEKNVTRHFNPRMVKVMAG